MSVASRPSDSSDAISKRSPASGPVAMTRAGGPAAGATTAGLAAYYVEEALGMWEPRIRVQEVTAGPDPNDPGRLLVEVRYEIKATHDSRSLVFPFYRIPGEAESEQQIVVSDMQIVAR